VRFWYGKSRILCLGNNTEHTDTRTRELAHEASSPCHGLLSELDQQIQPQHHEAAGFYHSSVYDIQLGRLVELANQFDGVIMLDQAQDSWSHPDAFYNTVRVMKQIAVPTQFLDADHERQIDYWSDLVKQNPSFCAFPFIELLVDRGNTTVCCRSEEPIVPVHKLKDYGTDPHYGDIRDRMMRGELVPEHCSSCYRLEDLGLPSARQQETVEWANRLGFRSMQDFASVSRPYYYEVRPSNRCNLQCRMCGPPGSHLLDREYRLLGLTDRTRPAARKFGSGFEIVQFDNLRKLYLAGGEPLVMSETYDFLDRCIREGRTDFEFLINTNGTKLSQKLLAAISNFSNLQFIFSIDAHDSLNHYIRWPSDWNTITENWRILRSRGHKVAVNTTISIYNVHRLHELYEFIDREFPGTLVHCQIVEAPLYLSPWLFPDAVQVSDSLQWVLATDCARNDQLFADSIRGYLRVIQQRNGVDLDRLREFYQFNDLLDANRNIALKDYVPELESFRSLVH
jgi:hypothetical protein